MLKYSYKPIGFSCLYITKANRFVASKCLKSGGIDGELGGLSPSFSCRTVALWSQKVGRGGRAASLRTF